jgi:hypothetical protein
VNTPSHLIINAALRRRAATSGLTIPRSFLLAAVLPDIPLFILWLGSYAYFRYVAGDASFSPMDQRLDQLYFTNPVWIAGHNMLHAPLLLIAALAALWRFRRLPATRGGWWFWFAAGCLVHTALDIPTHVDDGPVLLFPLDWSYRFQSPISYWDPRHFGREFGWFELGLNVVLLVYLAWPWLMRRLLRRGQGEAPGVEG